MKRRFVFRKLVCGQCDVHVTAFVEDGVESRCACGGLLERDVPAPLSPTMIDDQLWGGPRWIENFGPEPIFCATKSEYRALCAAHGMVNKVRHVPVPGTDKSPITTSWDVGLPPGVDARPFAMLTPAEQQVRREEAAARFGCTVAELEAWGTNLETAGLHWPDDHPWVSQFTYTPATLADFKD